MLESICLIQVIRNPSLEQQINVALTNLIKKQTDQRVVLALI